MAEASQTSWATEQEWNNTLLEQSLQALSISQDFIITDTQLKEALKPLVDENGEIRAETWARTKLRHDVCTHISSLGRALPASDREAKLLIDELTEARIRLGRSDDKILAYLVGNKLIDEAVYNIRTDHCKKYTRLISDAILRLEDTVTVKLQRNSSPLEEERKNVKAIIRTDLERELPKLKLPTFDGEPELWSTFIYQFEKIMEQAAATNYHKYLYLKNQVRGKAAAVFQLAPTSDEDYEAVKNYLESTFSSTTQQHYSLIRQMTELKLNTGNDCYQWMAKADELLTNMTRLEVDAKTIMQYFMWNGMSTDIRNHFILALNLSFPSYDQIKDTVFEVMEQFKAMKDRHTNIPLEAIATPTSTAAQNRPVSKQGKKPIQCSLCTFDEGRPVKNHPLYDCPVYTTPKLKYLRLRDIRGCTKCGFTGHEKNSCKYKLTRACGHCDGQHLQFLCYREEIQQSSTQPASRTKKSKSKKKSKAGQDPTQNQPSTTTSVVSTTSVQPEITISGGILSESVLSESPSTTSTNTVTTTTVLCIGDRSNLMIPTFSAYINPKKGSQLRVRVLYDTASQSSFITQKLVDSIPHTNVESPDYIKVAGFNETKVIQCEVVNFQMSTGNRRFSLDAIVVPTIPQFIRMNRLGKLLDDFRTHDIELGDKDLRSEGYGAIDILMGTNAMHDFPVIACSLGEGRSRSITFCSPAGVLLCGDMDRATVNSRFLPRIRRTLREIDNY